MYLGNHLYPGSVAGQSLYCINVSICGLLKRSPWDQNCSLVQPASLTIPLPFAQLKRSRGTIQCPSPGQWWTKSRRWRCPERAALSFPPSCQMLLKRSPKWSGTKAMCGAWLAYRNCMNIFGDVNPWKFRIFGNHSFQRNFPKKWLGLEPFPNRWTHTWTWYECKLTRLLMHMSTTDQFWILFSHIFMIIVKKKQGLVFLIRWTRTQPVPNPYLTRTNPYFLSKTPGLFSKPRVCPTRTQPV